MRLDESASLTHCCYLCTSTQATRDECIAGTRTMRLCRAAIIARHPMLLALARVELICLIASSANCCESRVSAHEKHQETELLQDASTSSGSSLAMAAVAAAVAHNKTRKQQSQSNGKPVKQQLIQVHEDPFEPDNSQSRLDFGLEPIYLGSWSALDDQASALNALANLGLQGAGLHPPPPSQPSRFGVGADGGLQPVGAPSSLAAPATRQPDALTSFYSLEDAGAPSPQLLSSLTHPQTSTTSSPFAPPSMLQPMMNFGFAPVEPVLKQRPKTTTTTRAPSSSPTPLFFQHSGSSTTRDEVSRLLSSTKPATPSSTSTSRPKPLANLSDIVQPGQMLLATKKADGETRTSSVSLDEITQLMARIKRLADEAERERQSEDLGDENQYENDQAGDEESNSDLDKDELDELRQRDGNNLKRVLPTAHLFGGPGVVRDSVLTEGNKAEDDAKFLRGLAELSAKLAERKPQEHSQQHQQKVRPRSTNAANDNKLSLNDDGLSIPIDVLVDHLMSSSRLASFGKQHARAEPEPSQDAGAVTDQPEETIGDTYEDDDDVEEEEEPTAAAASDMDQVVVAVGKKLPNATDLRQSDRMNQLIRNSAASAAGLSDKLEPFSKIFGNKSNSWVPVDRLALGSTSRSIADADLTKVIPVINKKAEAESSSASDRDARDDSEDANAENKKQKKKKRKSSSKKKKKRKKRKKRKGKRANASTAAASHIGLVMGDMMLSRNDLIRLIGILNRMASHSEPSKEREASRKMLRFLVRLVLDEFRRATNRANAGDARAQENIDRARDDAVRDMLRSIIIAQPDAASASPEPVSSDNYQQEQAQDSADAGDEDGKVIKLQSLFGRDGDERQPQRENSPKQAESESERDTQQRAKSLKELSNDLEQYFESDFFEDLADKRSHPNRTQTIQMTAGDDRATDTQTGGHKSPLSLAEDKEMRKEKRRLTYRLPLPIYGNQKLGANDKDGYEEPRAPQRSREVSKTKIFKQETREEDSSEPKKMRATKNKTVAPAVERQPSNWRKDDRKVARRQRRPKAPQSGSKSASKDQTSEADSPDDSVPERGPERVQSPLKQPVHHRKLANQPHRKRTDKGDAAKDVEDEEQDDANGEGGNTQQSQNMQQRSRVVNNRKKGQAAKRKNEEDEGDAEGGIEDDDNDDGSSLLPKIKVEPKQQYNRQSTVRRRPQSAQVTPNEAENDTNEHEQASHRPKRRRPRRRQRKPHMQSNATKMDANRRKKLKQRQAQRRRRHRPRRRPSSRPMDPQEQDKRDDVPAPMQAGVGADAQNATSSAALDQSPGASARSRRAPDELSADQRQKSTEVPAPASRPPHLEPDEPASDYKADNDVDNDADAPPSEHENSQKAPGESDYYSEGMSYTGECDDDGKCQLVVNSNNPKLTKAIENKDEPAIAKQLGNWSSEPQTAQTLN